MVACIKFAMAIIEVIKLVTQRDTYLRIGFIVLFLSVIYSQCSKAMFKPNGLSLKLHPFSDGPLVGILNALHLSLLSRAIEKQKFSRPNTIPIQLNY